MTKHVDAHVHFLFTYSFYGDDASRQPGNLQEVMLHETSVAWIRRRETVTQMRQPWTETVEQLGVRMRGIVQHINANHDVENLCSLIV